MNKQFNPFKDLPIMPGGIMDAEEQDRDTDEAIVFAKNIDKIAKVLGLKPVPMPGHPFAVRGARGDWYGLDEMLIGIMSHINFKEK